MPRLEREGRERLKSGQWGRRKTKRASWKARVKGFNKEGISTVTMLPSNSKTYIYIKTCTRMFIAALIVIAKMWKQLICSSTDVWVSKMCLSIQWNTIQLLKEMEYWCIQLTQINLKNIMLSQRKETQKDTYYIIPFMCNVQTTLIYRNCEWLSSSRDRAMGNDCIWVRDLLWKWWRCSVIQQCRQLHNLINILKIPEF